jgi:hypothetical protein
MVLFWVFFFQVLFNIFKVLEIRYTLEKQVGKLMVNSVYIGLVSLGSMFFSIEQMLQGNFLVIVFYIGGSVVGKWVGMNIETDKEKQSKKFSIFEYFY